jgi:OTU domain-containing protein 3
MVNSVITSLPFLANDETIRKALHDNNGSIDAAVSQLLDEPTSTPSSPGSYSSQSGSSSVERDTNSDEEEEIWGPNKRQNRKIRAMRRKEKDVQLPDMAAMKTLYI